MPNSDSTNIISVQDRIIRIILKYFKCFHIFIAFFIILFTASNASAAIATLSWCENKWPDLSHYTIFFKKNTETVYQRYNVAPGQVIPSTSVTCLDSNPISYSLSFEDEPLDITYQFKLGISDLSGNEVIFSTIAEKTFEGSGIGIDSDGDGVDDHDEKLAGTNLNDSADNLPVVTEVYECNHLTSVFPGIKNICGVGSDPNNDPLLYFWQFLTLPAGFSAEDLYIPGVTDVNKNPLIVKLIKAGDYSFRLKVKDGNLHDVYSFPLETTLNVQNIAPLSVLIASEKRGKINVSVPLKGYGTDPNDDPLFYEWRAVTAPAGIETDSINIIDKNTPNASFIPNAPGNYAFEFIVHDNYDRSGLQPGQKAVMWVTAEKDNQIAVADAGADKSAVVYETVNLSGAGSSDADSADGKPVSYKWALVEYPSVLSESEAASLLFGSVTVNPHFIPSVMGVYKFSLVVSDGINDSIPDYVNVAVNGLDNSIPIANAGDDILSEIGNDVALSGGKSSAYNNKPLVFKWKQTNGIQVELYGSDTMTPNFTPVFPDVYIFELIVSDGGVESLSDNVIVTVNGINNMPVADAGTDMTIVAGERISLNGSGSSDTDGTSLEYFWQQTKGPAVQLSDENSVQPFFEPVLPGGYEFQLTVFDGLDYSASDIVTINVIDTANAILTADAGIDTALDLPVNSSKYVMLYGSAYNPDGDMLQYNWTQVTEASDYPVILEGAGTSNPTFNIDFEGTYLFRLIVNDTRIESLPETVSVFAANKILGKKIISTADSIKGKATGFSFELSLPEGALPKDTFTAVGESFTPAPSQAGVTAIGKPLIFGLSGEKLLLPASVKIYFSSKQNVNIVIFSYDPLTDTWEQLTGIKGKNYLIVQTDKLFKLAVGTTNTISANQKSSGGGGCGFVKNPGNRTGGGADFMLMVSAITVLYALKRFRII